MSASIPGDDSVSETARSEAASALDSERQMTEFSIVRAGRYYYYEGYRYERLDDAIAFAQVVRLRPAHRPSAPLFAPTEPNELPSASDRGLMTELAITFVNGRFVFAGFQYDRLIDAVNYAHHLRDCRPAAS